MLSMDKATWHAVRPDLKLLVVKHLAEFEGLTAKLIAGRVGVKTNTIVTFCRRNGVQLPSRSETARFANMGRRKENCSAVVRMAGPPVVRNETAKTLPGIPFSELTKRHCRYPLWGDARVTLNQKRFCGEPTRDGAGYCSVHEGMVHRSEDGI